MKEKEYKHIFFDLDRTLWDFKSNSSEVLRDIISEFSLSADVPDKEEFLRKYNFYNDRLWDSLREGKIRKFTLRQERFRLLLKDYGLNDMELVQKINRYYMNTCPLKTLLIKNTEELLSYLYNKYKLYIISNGFYDVQLTKMISSGISKYFKKVFTSDRIGFAKPNPGIFEYVIRSEKLNKDECLMIGDDFVNDIEGAKNIKIDQVYFNPENIKAAFAPNYIISDLLEIRNFL